MKREHGDAWGGLRPQSVPASIPRGDVPCRAVLSRAELFWRDSDRLLRPFSSAGAAGADVTAAEANQEANRSVGWVLPLSLPPCLLPSHHPEGRKHLGRVGVRQRRKKERMRGWGPSDMPERRDFGPGEPINSSLQWFCERPGGQQGSLWMGRKSGRTWELFHFLPTGALEWPKMHIFFRLCSQKGVNV